MIKQTPGKIFLADQRGVVETSEFRRYSTFTFGAYTHEHKSAFGSLYALNEETLGGTQHLKFTTDRPTYMLLIPVTGEVVLNAPSGSVMVGVEEIQVLALPAHTTFELVNPYTNELVTFLHLWLQAEHPIAATSSEKRVFRLATTENQLAEVVPAGVANYALPFSLHMGRFAGRREAEYTLSNSAALFAFVLAGAFEVEGRLLHEKDGLALWDTQGVEIEALSNNALLLVLEL
jgi:hypothetical protein